MLIAGSDTAAPQRKFVPHLVTTDCCGRESHGVSRVPRYLGQLQVKVIRPRAQMKILRDMGHLLMVRGGMNFGQVTMTSVMAEPAYEALGTKAVSPLFEMALEATKEAVYNSLLQATTVQSRFGPAAAIPIDRLRETLMRK